MKNDKKLAAVLAAVSTYIKSEEEAALQASPGMAPGMPGTLKGFNPWGMSGRQSMMQMRNLMQLKSFSGFKLR
ncbi:MAG: hypothetical protein WBG37_18560 [Desulfobacterales bacterium]|jgi:hypothetical protein